ncbi:hypothetical protein EUX98_g6442 [Antrodiella citrinella]|uniref:Uncharacterized protein n=1 Tax=Antrodiella citrinella TaxID=2447956 RepID=A0A4S4MWH3_9APHY|nr:hypothetical protein EUX98_g6442 [Antrodiella citrinella]
MVVTRRAPVLPAPTSRTNSSQPIPRIKKPDVGAVSSPLASDATADALQVADQQRGAKDSKQTESSSNKAKSKGKTKQKKKSSRGNVGLMELLTRAFLLFFTIYTLSVCPTDEHLKSPVCRGLHEYRRLILEPYLLPHLENALAHPAVAPYVDRAKPYAVRLVAIAKPIALRTQQEWDARVVPQWKKRVVPQWNKHAIPTWNKYAVPQIQRVEQQLGPHIRTISSEYNSKVSPYLQLAVHNLQNWRTQAQPYVVLAAQQTYMGYQTAKPYAIPVLQRLQIVFAELVRFLVAQRRQFVDPHLKRIWEGVIELSGGKPTIPLSHVRPVAKTPVVSSASNAAHAVSSVASSAVSSVLSPSPSPLPPKASSASVGAPLSVLPASATSSETLLATITTEYDLSTSAEQSTSAPVSGATEAVQAASSYAEGVASLVVVAGAGASSSASSLVSSLTGNAAPSASALLKEAVAPIDTATSEIGSTASSVAEVASSAFSRATSSAIETVAEAVATASVVTDHASSLVSSSASAVSETVRSDIPTPSAVSEDDDIDMEAFYAELGLNGEDEPTPDLTVPESEETETEEEKAEKLRLRKVETAKKRADITSRHTKWEQQLEEVIADSRKALRKQLVALRKAAVVDLKESKEIRKEIESLVEEAEKFLKGAEKYLANLKRESRRPEEKSTMWERVILKVDSKFGERLAQTEAVVNGWYNEMLNSELLEVQKLSDSVRAIADRAQTDIGLDYAWLDDVTYQDWQRYHDLVRASEQFTELATSIQNGSHPSPPINPVLPALADLQAEVQDVVVGFETRLRRVKRNGDRAFGAIPGDEDVNDGEESDTPADETVSILPIEQDEKKEPVPAQSPLDVHQVIIGRSKEEVVAALNRAAEVDAGATSIPEDATKDPEEVVESLASEVESEATSSAVHVEL